MAAAAGARVQAVEVGAEVVCRLSKRFSMKATNGAARVDILIPLSGWIYP